MLHSGCFPTLPSLLFPFRSPSWGRGGVAAQARCLGAKLFLQAPCPQPARTADCRCLSHTSGQPLVSPDKGQEILDHHPLKVTPSTMGTELQRGRGSSSGARAQQGAGGGATTSAAAALAAECGWEQTGTAEQQETWVPNPPSQEPVLFPSLGLSCRSPRPQWEAGHHTIDFIGVL